MVFGKTLGGLAFKKGKNRKKPKKKGFQGATLKTLFRNFLLQGRTLST